MNIPRLFVRRPVTTLMVFLAVVLLGLVSFRQIPVQLLPDLSVPGLGITVSGTGGSIAETVEETTRPIESIVAEVPRVRRIRSWTGSWGAWIQVEFEPGTDIRFATLDLQERLNRFQRERNDRRLMTQVIPFSTSEINQFLAEIALEGSDDREYLSQLARDLVAPRLETISGIARIEVGSATRDAVEVRLDTGRMAGFNIEFAEVVARLNSAGTDDAFVGELRVPGERHFVYLDPMVTTIESLRELPLGPQGVIRLRDVAEVLPTESIQNRVYRSNGRMAVGINVEREEGANLVEVARRLRAEVDAINEELPGDSQLVFQTDIADVVESAIAEVRNLALIGALLALFVPLFFFRSWRIAGIVFLSVPICIIAVFNLFYFFGISLNIFSIIGLALGVGMLVDNSIVVVENCFRVSGEGRLGPLAAAEVGSAEVGRALFAATLTTCVPFLALFFVDGEFGLIIREPTMALVFPLIVSLGVAMTLSAMLTSRALIHTAAEQTAATRPPSRLAGFGMRVRARYRRMLKACLRHRGTLLVVIAGIVVMTFLDACERVEQSSIAQDQTPNVFRVYAEMAPGSEISETSGIVAQIEARLLELPDVERFGAWFRSGSATFDITLLAPRDRPSGRSLSQIRNAIIDEIGDVAGAELSLDPPEAPIQPGPPTGGGEVGILEIKGIDYDSLFDYGERVVESLRLLPEVASARLRVDSPTEELRGLVDRERSRLFDLRAQTIGQFVGATASGGQISNLILRDGERRTDVAIVVEGSEAESIDAVRAIPVVTGDGARVSMGDLLALETERVPGGRRRVDRMATVSLEYSLNRGTSLRGFRSTIRDVVSTVPNPAGVIVEEGGEQAQIDERQRDFIFVLSVGLLFIYIVMAAAFESFWVPFTILLTNPLMLIGIVFALAITGLPFEELAAFGVILLNGLAVNNGIVMMDTVMRLRREKGFSVKRSLMQAADQRLRPIVMTYLTTTVGLLPLALSGSEDSHWRPVAVTVMGGLTTATILMLFVLPCIYLVGEDFVGYLRPRAMRAGRWGLLKIEKTVNGTIAFLFALPRPWRWMKGLRKLRVVPAMIVHALCLIWRGLLLPLIVARAIAGDVMALVFPRRKSQQSESEEIEERLSTRSVSLAIMEDLEITTSNLRASFKTGRNREVVAVRSLNCHMERGLVGLIGPNGAGKTTLLRMVAGVLKPDRGTVRIATNRSSQPANPAGVFVAYLPQRVGSGPETVSAMMEESALDAYRAAALWIAKNGSDHPASHFLDGALRLGEPMARRERIREATASVNMLESLDSPLSSLSGGMRRRAALAAALLADKPILLVDEPTAGLDPNERLRVRLLLADYSRSALVVLSTHIIEDIDGYCDQLVLLNRGACIHAGSAEDFLNEGGIGFWEVDEADQNLVARSESLGAILVSRTVYPNRVSVLFANDSVPDELRSFIRSASLEERILAMIKRTG